ncbi:aspartyl/asparaginyl beta-hydroxylase domain-containing protein [Flavobacterium sp.]|uniref:aspartyl/asparaginyl beta-hydroxylase domain-containing protein n=1 Tax=Flavobacterium sp. TaxID=239 RepID=UPI003D0BEC65
MTELVRYIKFPFQFNVSLLEKEVLNILSTHWINHYNTNDYEGRWTSVSLMSEGGKTDNIYALPTHNDAVMPTEILDHCDYIKEILDTLQFQKTAVRLLNLARGARIKPHKDYCLGYEDGCFRIHIPILTNPQVEFLLDNHLLEMKAGECWYINANFTHSVVNNGENDRIHLVIDGIRNEWTDALFFKHAPEEQLIKKENTFKNSEEKEKIIEELRKMNTPIADKLIADLLNE